MNLSNAAKVTRVSNAVAAGTTEIDATGVDMQGFEAVEFLVAFGAITAGAVTSCKLQGSHDNATNWTDLAGTAITVLETDDNKVAILDTAHTLYRYIRPVVVRGTQNAAVDAIVALQYLADREPVTQPTSVLGTEFHNAAAAGVA
jgi:hypothetical protein